MSTDVTRSDDRFVLTVDGTEAGFARFREHDADGVTVRDFTHTEIDDAHAGQGLSGVLVEAAVQQTRADGLRIKATCPLVAHWLGKHPEHDDIVEPTGD